MTVSTTSTLMTGALCYPGTRSLYSIPGSSPKRLRRSYDGFDRPNGLNGQDNHNCHDKIFAPGQAGNLSVLPGDFLGTPGDVIPHPRLYKYTVCKELVYGYRSLADDQAGRILQCKRIGSSPQGTMIKAFVARFWRTRMSPSWSPPSI